MDNMDNMTSRYNVNMRVNESLESYYKRIAKVADQRLRRLEQLAKEEGYGNADKWSYQRAMYDIQKWRGEGAKRFGETSIPADRDQLKAKINDIQDFLNSATSTKEGIKQAYKKKAESFNKSQGTNISWENWAEYLDRFGANLYKEYGSKVMNRVIKTLQGMKKADPELNAEKLHHLALLRKNGGYKFNYVKADGSDGSYDIHVDNAIHEIFRKRKDIEDIYRLLIGK